MEEAGRLEGRPSGNLGHAYALAGDAAAANRVLHQLLEASAHEYVPPYQIAIVYLGLGNRASALDWFEKAYQEREGVVLDLVVDPRLASISADPRFQAMLQKSGLKFVAGHQQRRSDG